MRDGNNEEVRQEFQRELSYRMEDLWPKGNDATVWDKWDAIRDTLRGTADSGLGYERKKQPDWYSESVDALEPVLK